LSVYGFNVEPDTFAAIRKAAPGLQGVSRERIREEFFKMLLGKHFPVAFNDMMRGRVIQQFLPELAAQQTAERTDSPQRHAAVFGRKQIITTEATENAERMQREPLQSDMTADRYGRCQELIEHSVNAVRHSPPRLTVRLAALFHHLGDLDLEQIGESSLEPLRRFRESALTAAAIMKRLRASRCLEKEVAFLVENQISEDSENWTQGDLRCFLATVDEGRLEDAMDLASADGKARRDGTHRLMTLRNLRLRISRELKRRPPLRIADLAVSGWDVMRVLNLEPGPAVGEVIRRLHRVVLEDPALNHRKILMDFLKKEYHIESRTDNGRHE
jgi:tRNA nucleotidyltransferase/poly(A) polymerase